MAKKRLKLKIKEPVRVKDRAVSEQKLIEAAEEEFSRNGFDGATTRGIALRAGVNLALIARYFEGKYGLLIAVLKGKKVELETLQLGEPKKTLTDECLNCAELRFLQMTKNVDFFRIVIGQFVTDDKFLRRYQETMSLKFENAQFDQRLAELIRAKKVLSKFSAESFIEVLERNIVSSVLFEVIMRKTPKEKVLVELKDFIKNYAGVFER